MKRIAALLLAFCLWIAQSGQAQQTSVVRKVVEPDYGLNTSRPGLLDPVRVHITVDRRGRAFAVEAEGSLPDPVVQAIQKWEFEGSDSGYIVSATVPVRRFPDRFTASPRTLVGLTTAQAEKARGLDAEGARKIERELESNPDDSEARTVLLAYAAIQRGEDAAAIRARQLTWLVENDPENGILGSSLALVNPIKGPLADAETYARLRQLWLEEAEANPDRPKILDHASLFLRSSDADAALSILSPHLADTYGVTAWVGDVYGLAAIGVTGFDPANGSAVAAVGSLPDDAIATRARAELDRTSNLRLLTSAAATVIRAGRSLAEAGELPAGFQPYCEALLQRVLEYIPETEASCETPVKGPSSGERTIIAAERDSSVAPFYPQLARQLGVQGKVVLAATINESGEVTELELVSGPLLLYRSAMDAVRRWKYRPTRVNGEAVSVSLTVDVNYALR